MISDYVKKQGQDYQKLHENRPLALFRNTSPLAAGTLYCPPPAESASRHAHFRRLAGADASPRTGRKLSKAPAPGLSSPASGSSHAGSQGIAIQRKLSGPALILQLSLRIS